MNLNECLSKLRGFSFSQEHDEEWRNGLAKDLEQLRARAIWTLECAGDGNAEAIAFDVEFAAALVRVIERVVVFEEIESPTQQRPRRQTRKGGAR